MRTKQFIPFMLVLFILTACSSQASQQVFITQTLASTPDFFRSTSVPKTAEFTPTFKSISTATAEVLPTQTLALGGVESLPKLSEVVISSSDFENIDLAYNPLILVSDATNELQNSCLWDCVKYRYALEQGTLTIMLLRAGDPQKAENTLDSLKKDFLKTVRHEYTADDLSTMPPGSWALVDQASSAEDYQTGAAGMTQGSIVILVAYKQISGDDLMELASIAVYFLKEQVRKLESAGYPK